MFLVIVKDNATRNGFEGCSVIRRCFYDCDTKYEVIQKIIEDNNNSEGSIKHIMAITELTNEEYELIQGLKGE